ncbi:hypothetical protein K435DRAFT_798890 [Dendrothele bispora CBS 962.96]|uniref:Uncharacterized protein n=1 Tax=Dendrothele bispora (strain CBS 962.96) TaxID=1314807 RepID=A0A4S8LXR5_DENBC|nr:hypothetical protein K435DRAFT_798890 [Dendrothele bispora CBS 962.96]
MSSNSIAGTYGSVLIGALISSMLSGVLAAQCITYISTFANDPLHIKGIIAVVEILDIAHSVIIWTGLWEWVVTDFGDMPNVDRIPRVIAAITTLITHWVFGWRIFKREQILIALLYFKIKKHFISVAAAVSSGEMLILQTFQSFRDQFMWLFSLGLSISVFVDVYITITMFIILRKTRGRSLTMNPVIDSLWVTMDNLVFLGLHFIVSKLYANSTLAVFNYRARLRHTHEQHLSMRANPGGIELVVLPNSPVVASPHNESRIVCRANSEAIESKELDREAGTEHPDLTPDLESSEGREMALNGVMKSVTVKGYHVWMIQKPGKSLWNKYYIAFTIQQYETGKET